jgi:hypothetical protein
MYITVYNKVPAARNIKLTRELEDEMPFCNAPSLLHRV